MSILTFDLVGFTSENMTYIMKDTSLPYRGYLQGKKTYMFQFIGVTLLLLIASNHFGMCLFLFTLFIFIYKL